MSAYYDTGVILKLYTEEEHSEKIREFVQQRGLALLFNSFHKVECISALRLKSFRGECTETQSTKAIGYIEDDIANGVLKMMDADWSEVWILSMKLAKKHASLTGCRTLDTLHVACALEMSTQEFITHDGRQAALARAVGFSVIDPVLQA